LQHVSAPVQGEHLASEAYYQATHPVCVVTADGEGVANHLGSAALIELAHILGLTEAYSNAMVSTRTRRSAHNPGRVLRDRW
jgi:hypothetical protein